MCGIVGVVTHKGGQLTPSILDAAVDSMQNRGPDDRGIVSLSDKATGTQGIFGHRRLSILDTSPAGHQPMSYRDGALVIVYNGEIYNFHEIRRELETYGYTFKSNCDTEVILAAYDKWGKDFIHRCNGMFAIALWDMLGKKLLLYRDRIGIKPLYYGFQGNRFYFGSTATAIANIEGFYRSVNSNALLAYIWLGYVPMPYCMFDDLHKLPPGYMAELNLHTWEVCLSQYWDICSFVSLGCEQPTVHNETEYINKLDTLLKDTVRMQLVSDVPVGAFLSGGIDSSTVVAIMQQVHNGPVRTFSIGFDIEQFNEAPMAQAIASYLGTEHQEHILSSEDIKKVIAQVPLVYDEPFSDSSCLPSLLLSKMTRQYVTVALSGDGGDELFFGDYNHYRVANRWNMGRFLPFALRALFANTAAQLPSRYLKRINRALACRNFAEFHCLIRAIWDTDSYADLIEGNMLSIVDTLPEMAAMKKLDGRNLSIPKIATTLDFYSTLPDDFLVKVDRASMAHSLEVRVPLLDHRIAEFSRELPESIFAGRGHKYLLKAVLEKYVPRNIWERPKKGFEVPLAHWFRTDLYGYLRENIVGNRLSFINKNTVIRMLEDHKSGNINNYRMLWSLLSLAMWHENNM